MTLVWVATLTSGTTSLAGGAEKNSNDLAQTKQYKQQQ